MEEYCKRSGQIPAFGDWDKANELPITQYFECARQAGLIRYSSSSGETESDPYVRGDLYAVDFNKPSRTVPTSRKRGEKRYPQVKEQKKVGKVYDVTEQPRKHTRNDAVPTPRPANAARPRPLKSKPVDEDLYKIPPELLYTSKRKKMLGFFSRCLVPDCAA
ncbi:ubiquitin hydrolase [Fagus crenata]